MGNDNAEKISAIARALEKLGLLALLLIKVFKKKKTVNTDQITKNKN